MLSHIVTAPSSLRYVTVSGSYVTAFFARRSVCDRSHRRLVQAATLNLKGMRIVQADSVPTPILRVGASRRKECPLFNSAGANGGGRLRWVGADSRSQTVYRNDFLILVPTLGIGAGN